MKTADPGETVYCDNPECENESFVRLTGTMPRNWFGHWIEAQRKGIRCCSHECIVATQQYYRELSGQWTICSTTIDTRKRK